MIFTKSRWVRDCDVVTLRRNKFIRCGRGMKPRGVWNEAGQIKFLQLDGTIKVIDTPSGVQYYGKAQAKVFIEGD